jgi:hypothetical protein
VSLSRKEAMLWERLIYRHRNQLRSFPALRSFVHSNKRLKNVLVRSQELSKLCRKLSKTPHTSSESGVLLTRFGEIGMVYLAECGHLLDELVSCFSLSMAMLSAAYFLPFGVVVTASVARIYTLHRRVALRILDMLRNFSNESDQTKSMLSRWPHVEERPLLVAVESPGDGDHSEAVTPHDLELETLFSSIPNTVVHGKKAAKSGKSGKRSKVREGEASPPIGTGKVKIPTLQTAL